MVAYRFEVSRGGKCVARHLEGFSGILQVDGYSAYTSMLKERAKSGSNETIKLAGCWAHVRRTFYELHLGGINDAATVSITAMTGRWKVEDEIRGSDAETRAKRRQETSAAIVAALFQLWEKELSKVSGKAKTAEAIRYALTRREALCRNRLVERAIRPQTITRKNSLFAGSEGSGETWATIAKLLQTAKMNNVDPLAWLSQTLTRIATVGPPPILSC
jgi:transposase